MTDFDVLRQRIRDVRERAGRCVVDEVEWQRITASFDRAEAEKREVRREVTSQQVVFERLSQRGLGARIWSWLQGGP